DQLSILVDDEDDLRVGVLGQAIADGVDAIVLLVIHHQLRAHGRAMSPSLPRRRPGFSEGFRVCSRGRALVPTRGTVAGSKAMRQGLRLLAARERLRARPRSGRSGLP